MTPEREQIVRDFVARYDEFPKSTWKNQDYMRELLEEIDSLRTRNVQLSNRCGEKDNEIKALKKAISEAENALSWVGRPCT